MPLTLKRYSHLPDLYVPGFFMSILAPGPEGPGLGVASAGTGLGPPGSTVRQCSHRASRALHVRQSLNAPLRVAPLQAMHLPRSIV